MLQGDERERQAENFRKMLVATANLFFRDLDRLTGVFMTLWFYLTPVMFTLELLQGANLGWVIYVNPMAPLILAWRQTFLEGWPSEWYVVVAAGWSVLFLIVGYLVYRAKQWQFAEVV